jgi:polyisoprenyl-phosphate glycosyltransferase
MEVGMNLFSIVAPVYNEESNVAELHKRCSDVLQTMADSYEIIFVNDGSEDRSFEKLKGLSELDEHVTIINFSRNFGHQIAVTAGIDYSRGDAVIVIDSDLQDPPELLPEMIQK